MPINQYGSYYNEEDGDPTLPGSDPRSAYAKQQAKIAAQQDAASKAQQAAAQATLKANDYRNNKGPGVFTLDQLHGLGQTGDTKTDWMASGGPAGGPIAGGGHAIIDPSQSLPAGYYQLPGMPAGQAYYYDPHSGQVSKEFSDWASGNIARDSTGKPTALMSGADSGDVFRAGNDQAPATLDTIGKIIAGGRSADGTYQDSQDKVLGIGAYQQSVTGKDGKQIRIQDTPNYQQLLASGAMGTPIATGAGPTVPPSTPTGGYTDVSNTQQGAFDRLLKKTGQTQDQLDTTLGLKNGKQYADYWTRMENTLAANYETNVSKATGLQAMRASKGLDVNTGTSAAETERISKVYASIQDPAERAAYLRYQDPGNLTPELRAMNYQLKAPERSIIAQYEKDNPQHIYDSAQHYGGPSGLGVDVTVGHQSMTDPATGREIFVGNVPVDIKAQEKPHLTDFEQGIARTGGAVYGAFEGFTEGVITGNPFAAVALTAFGAYKGVGGPLPNAQNISWKNAKGWGQWEVGEPERPDIKTLAINLGTAVAFAKFGSFLSKYAPAAAETSAAAKRLAQIHQAEQMFGAAAIGAAKERQQRKQQLMGRPS